MKNPILLQKPTPDHCGPGYVGKSKYLETKNLLSEFDTEEKRLTVLRNLGILNNQIDVVLELGDDTHAVMSQKAVTEAINNNKNIEIYESENNLPTSAATGRIAAVVYQTNNETVNRLYFKNEEAWKSINDVKIVDAENKLDPSAPLGTISVVAINKLQKFLSDLSCPRELKTAEDFELLEFIEEPLVINAPVHVDLDLSGELITLTFAQDFYTPLQTNSTDILPNLPHYIYIGKSDDLTSDDAAWGIYHFSQTLGGGIIAEYDSNGDRISYNEMQIQDLNLYLKYQYRYKYWVSKKTIPNYDIVNTFIAVGQTVMTTVPYIKDFDKWSSLLNADILYIDEAKLSEYEVEQDGTIFLVRVPKDRLKEITRGVDFIDFKNYSRICVGDNIYPLFLEDGMYTTPIKTLIEEDYAIQIIPMVISGFSDSYTFLSGYNEVELAGITIANDSSDLSSNKKVGSIATTQESVDDTKTVSEYYELIQGNFPTRLREIVIDPKESTNVRVEGYHNLDTYVYNVSIDGKPISLASLLGRLIISEFSPNYSSENAVWGIYCSISSISLQESAVLEYDLNGNRITWNPDALTAFNNSKLVGNAGGKVYGGYISDFDPYLSVLDGILYFSNTTTRTTLYLKHDFNGWEKYYSPIKNSSIKLEHLSDEVTKTLKGINIYDSENSLPVNSEAGNIATVSNINTEEIEVEDRFSVRDIYVEENPDCEPLMELKITVPETWPTEACLFVFGPKGYNNIDELVHGRYLGLMLTEEGFGTVVLENRSPIIAPQSPLVTDYSIVEETLAQVNEIISSWGGVVCYGVPVEGDAPAVTAPTEAQIEAIDSFIGYNNGTHIETLETHVNDIYFKETTGWRKINDVKIVDSVDKLDKNAPQGSLATVADTKVVEIPAFSAADIDIHANSDCEPVKKFKFKIPEDIPSINDPISFFFTEKGAIQIREDGTLDFDTLNPSAIAVDLTFNIWGGVFIVSLHLSSVGDQFIIYDKFINIRAVELLNEAMSKGVVLYGAGPNYNYSTPTEEQIKLIDSIFGYDAEVVVKGGNTVFIKEDKWNKVNDARVITKDLLPSDAEVGSIRVVTEEKRKWVSSLSRKVPCMNYDFIWDELINTDVTVLTPVNSVQIFSNKGIINEGNGCEIDFLRRDVENWLNINNVKIKIDRTGIDLTINMSGHQLALVEENSYIIDNSALMLLNETLSKGDFCIATTSSIDDMGLEGIVSFKDANGDEIPLSEIKIVEDGMPTQQSFKIFNKEIFTKAYGIQISKQITDYKYIYLLPDRELVSEEEYIVIKYDDKGVSAEIGDTDLALAAKGINEYVLNQDAIDFINSTIKDGYLYLPFDGIFDDQILIDNQIEELYIKRETGWEEYDKATKDKVATLETKVAELEAKIQELLNSLQTN